MKTCVFAGSFDPFTTGHECVVKKCLEIFDKVVIAVGKNADKQPLLSESERVELIRATFDGDSRVEVALFDGMLVDFMKENKIYFTVRGIRNVDDYKYESTMAQYNLDLCPEISTIYLPTPASIAHVSSSGVRIIVKTGGDYSKYIPEKAREFFDKIIKSN